MTLRHEIETSVNSRTNPITVDGLEILMDHFAGMHGCEIEVNKLATNVRIFVEGNGAVLRDVVTRLDRAGYLD